jgi:prevent-host-death family protein
MGRTAGKRLGIFEAKAHLSSLVERTRRGERFIITKHGVPVAELVPANGDERLDLTAIARELGEIRGRTRRGRESMRELRDEGRRR